MDRLGAQAIGRPSNRIVRPGILIPAKRSRRPTRKSPVWTIKPKPLRIPGEDFCASSIRGLIVLVLVIGGWLGWIVRSAHIQRDAVAAITRAGGWVRYDWGWTRSSPTLIAKTSKPGWLADLIGIDYIGHVTVVWLTASRTVTDATIVQVGRLTRLQQLRLDQSSVRDTDPAHLTTLTKLARLNLDGTRISDAGLAHLKELTKLSSLDINGSQVTEAGVRDLQQALPSLKIYR